MIRVERGHGSRGSGANDVDLPYRRIGALNPDFFVQFKYPVYAEQQVLFRDPECTSPVTDAGNHTIGGVKNPFTGEIILTQANAAAKPLWGGPSVGAIFDKIDDYLESPSNVVLGLPYTLVIRQANTNADTDRQTFIHYGLSYFFRQSNALNSSRNYTFPSDDTYPDDMLFHTLIKEALAQPPSATASVSWDGNRVEQTQPNESEDFLTNDKIIIGSQAGSVRFAAMNAQYMCAFGRLLSPAETAIVNGVL